MAGYGMHDGTAIINAIGQYADYTERQKDKTYARNRQAKLDEERSSRQAIADNRSETLFNRQTDEYDNKVAERDQSKQARQSYVDSISGDIDAQEQAAIQRNQRLSRSVSRSGDEITPVDNGDGTTSFGVLKDNGEQTQLTSNPNDDKSKPLRAKNEDLPRLQEHAQRSIDIAEKNGVEPENHSAYIRAGFTSDENGNIREASESEFMSNLKSHGLLKGKQTSPDSDVPINAGEGAPTVKPEGDGSVTASDLANPIGFVQRKMAESVFVGLEQMYNKGAAGARKIMEAGNWLSDGAKERGFGDTVKKTANQFVMGKNAKASIEKKGEVKILPSNKVETPEGVDDLVDTKETVESMGSPPLKARAELKPVLQSDDAETRMQAIHEKYATRRKRAAVVGELYLTNNIDEGQMRNYMETGDMRVSKMELDKHNVALDVAEARGQAAVATAEAKRFDAQRKYVDLAGKNYKSDVKRRNDALKFLQDEGSNIADWYSGRMGLKGQQAAGVRGRVKALATSLMGSETFSIDQMKDPKFGAMFNEGVRSFLANKGEDNNLSAETVLPFINTALGKFKPNAAQTILGASKNSGRSLREVRNAYDKKLMRYSDAAKEKGLDWNEERQKLFDTGFTSDNL
ncbi:hypothetical protein [Pseudoalteromonas sp. SWYJZ19]|uniref:hypothetical protein n=1 Tax=Pseudoalteromonas sp. SWYJZ19 TaxID=2792068 RepID=UPI0018CEB1CA|nr:hypothetical protein [Pseudoalteromonas sp. SWYJZ19]MBH0050717.1 hypothetical protein [Pseudoalteromonas sp. SWYJZ19]